MIHWNEFAQEIHADNVNAGWWTDLTTGADIHATRNRGELLMLVVSELAEAADGARLDLFDDKLPHRKMIEVELGDAAIRIFDIAGADMLDIGGAAREMGSAPPMNHYFGNPNAVVPACLMQIVCQVSRAMESNRKKNARDALLSTRSGYECGLACAMLLIYEIAKMLDLDVDAAIAEKRAFNAVRADHKVENRKAVGGKLY